jgi:predicted acetyltransferase
VPEAPAPGSVVAITLRLRPLRIEDEQQARAAHAELAGDDFTFLLDWDPAQPWSAYVERMADREHARELPSDRVPASFLVAEHEGALVGRVSIRHQLNEFLAAYAGHVGYGVRPQHRRRGHESEILRQAVIIARAHGVENVLVTCDEDNLASAVVIERQGGVLEDRRVDPDGILKRRYWIA